MAFSQPHDRFSSLSISGSPDVANDASNLQDEAQGPRCRILGLPQTIRRRIYDFILNTRYASGPSSFDYVPRIVDGMLRLKATRPVFPLQTAILLTNHQIHDEASSVLWSSNRFIRLTLYNDDLQAAKDLIEHSEMGFVSSNPDSLSKMTNHALDVEISEIPHHKRKRCVVLFPALFLPRFVNFLRQICNPLPLWGKNHRLVLTLRNQSSGSLHHSIGALLEPWRVLQGLSAVSVDTKLVDPAYARSLEEAMTNRGIKPGKWLKSVTEFQETGAQLLREGKWDEASSISALVGITMNNTFHNAALAPALQKTSPLFHKAVSRRRFLSELDISLALVRLGSKDVWGRALTAVDNAVDLAEDSNTLNQVWMMGNVVAIFQPKNDASWYSNEERSKARLTRGSLMMVVGEHGYACNDFSVAKSFCPKDTAIAQALDEAKGKYDTKILPGAALQRAGISCHH